MTDSPEEEAVLDKEAKDYAAYQARMEAKKIPLVELFGPTVQGEGSVIGQQTYFLRFGLCDYLCTMCDSLHAVIPAQVKANAEWLTQAQIFEKVSAFHKPNSTNWITYSGGNPLVHDLSALTEGLKNEGWKINVETQGTRYHPWLQMMDSITISPKGPGMGEVTHLDVLDKFIYQVMNDGQAFGVPNASLKIVAFDQRDLDFAADIFERYQKYIPYDNCYLSLGNPQPPDPVADRGKTFTIEDVWMWKQDLLDQYKLLFEDIQTHRILSQVKFLPQWHAFVWGNGQGH